MSAIRTTLRLLLGAAAVGASLGAGCAANDGGDASARTTENRFDDGRSSSYNERAADDLIADDQNVRRGDRDDEEPLVPKTARLVAEGRGDLSYKATRDGFAYIIDNREKKMIFEGPLDEGETLAIAPYRNVIEVNGKTVKRVKDLNNKHIHRVYFERARDRGRDRRDRAKL